MMKDKEGKKIWKIEFLRLSMDTFEIKTEEEVGREMEEAFVEVRYEKNGFYSSSNCADSNLVFYILKGKKIEIIDSSYTTTVAKVKYAGSNWLYLKSQLKF